MIWSMVSPMGIGIALMERDEMDEQTAIDLLDNLLGMVEDNHGSDYDKAIHMGIDALKTQDMSGNMSGTQKPLDCISRQAVIDAIQQHRKGVLGSYEYDEGVAFVYAVAHNHIIDVIKKLPSVQQEQRG